jgi:hypothetical protein
MNNIDAMIVYMGFFAIITMGIIIAFTGNVDMGCHIIGSEINGDNSVEYLKLGNC